MDYNNLKENICEVQDPLTNNDQDHKNPQQNNKLICNLKNHVIETEDNTDGNESVCYMMKEISKISYSTTLTYICIFLQETISLIFIGQRYNDGDYAEAIGFANLYVNCFFIEIAYGLASGFDTFGSNSFGVNKLRLFGLYYQRGILITGLIGICLLTFHWFFAMKIIGILNLSEKILAICKDYIQISMFYGFFDIFFYINFKFLSIIGLSYILVIIMVVTLALHPLWCYIFIFVLDYGASGAALSIVLTQLLNALLTTAMVIFKCPYPQAIFCFTKRSFKNWWIYLKVSFPCIILTCAEMWAYEFLIVIALWCSDLDNKVYVLTNNLLWIFYSIEIGFNYAAVILVGKYMAQNEVSKVKKIIKVTILYGVSLMTILALILFFLRHVILYIYIDDHEIIEKGVNAVIIMAAGLITESIQSIMQGICRGLGKQLIASIIVFVSFYIFMFGLSIVFGKLLGMGVSGIWLSYVTGTTFSTIAYTIIIILFDYSQLYKEALERVNNSNDFTKDIEKLEDMEKLDDKLDEQEQEETTQVPK